MGDEKEFAFYYNVQVFSSQIIQIILVGCSIGSIKDKQRESKVDTNE